jgi:hypothetical protein
MKERRITTHSSNGTVTAGKVVNILHYNFLTVCPLLYGYDRTWTYSSDTLVKAFQLSGMEPVRSLP